MKYVFVDMDGTIAEWGYPDGRISGKYKFGDYIDKQPINDVIAEIYNKYSNSEEYIILVISAIPNTQASIEKDAWLNRYFNIPYENRIYIRVGEDKVDIINFYLRQVLRTEPAGNAILIDDRKDWLTKAMDMGIEVYHPTKIITSYQNRMESLCNKENEDNKDEEIEEKKEN